MNLLKLISGLILIPVLAVGQIPNPSFESWNSLLPDGWLINSSPPLLLPVSSSTDAHSGNFALKGEIVDDLGVPFGPYIEPLSSGLGFPVNQNDTTLYGFYKANMIGGNLGLVEVWVYDSLYNQVGSGFTYLTSASNYTEFSIPILYVPGIVAKEMSIIMQMTDTNLTSHFNVGSYFLIDDLSYSHTSTVNVSTPEKSFYSISPNPANDHITIKSGSTSNKNYITIYDVTGKKVLNINQTETSGQPIDVSELQPGSYVMLVTDGTHAVSQKIQIIR